MDIISHVQQVICFAFHDSNLLMETCSEAKNMRKIVTLFYLDWQMVYCSVEIVRESTSKMIITYVIEHLNMLSLRE